MFKYYGLVICFILALILSFGTTPLDRFTRIILGITLLLNEVIYLLMKARQDRNNLHSDLTDTVATDITKLQK